MEREREREKPNERRDPSYGTRHTGTELNGFKLLVWQKRTSLPD